MCCFNPILTKITKTRNPKKTESENFEQKLFQMHIKAAGKTKRI